MSFNRLESSDFVLSSDAISAPIWSTNSPALTTFFSSSTQIAGSSGKFYLTVYNSSSLSTPQFDIAYGNALGSGSLAYNSTVSSNSPTSTVYGQFQDLVLGDENTDFVFGNITSSEFFALTFERARFKETLLPGSLTLRFTSASVTQTITDNSLTTVTPQYVGSNRVFQLVSGSAGSLNTSIDSNGYTKNSGSYGWLLPDIGTILLNPRALAAPAISGGMALQYSASNSSVTPNISPNLSLFAHISGGANFVLNSNETISSNYLFIRARSSEFNYSINPSYISGSTGEIVYSDFINSPRSYITTVGLYTKNGELVAIGKLGTPIKKRDDVDLNIIIRFDV